MTIPKPRAIKRIARLISEFCFQIGQEQNLSVAILTRLPQTVQGYRQALVELKTARNGLDETIRKIEEAFK